MMTAHISHRADILVFTVLQLLFQGLELSIQNTDIALNMLNILLDTFNILLSLVYLTIDSHQVLQAFLHILLILTKSLFLLPDFLLDIGTLTLQSSDRSIAIGSSLFLCLSWGCMNRFRCILGNRLSSCNFLLRSLTNCFLADCHGRFLPRRFMLRKRRKRKRKC